MKRRTHRFEQAFTLIELLAVIGIIIVLVGIVMAGAGFANRAADRTKARSQVEMIQTALDRYNVTFTRFPTNIALNPLRTKAISVYSNMVEFVPELKNIRIQTNNATDPVSIDFLDPWNQPIAYRMVKQDSCELRSFGPDGVSNTVDDIVTSRGE
jgi:type II secretory pathway pseudopilin PulG